jgi:hypothetical protein
MEVMRHYRHSVVAPEENRENKMCIQDDHAWMVLNLCVQEKEAFISDQQSFFHSQSGKEEWRNLNGQPRGNFQ